MSKLLQDWFGASGVDVTLPQLIEPVELANRTGPEARKRVAQEIYETRLEALKAFIDRAYLRGKEGVDVKVPEEWYNNWVIRERTLLVKDHDGRPAQITEPYIALGCASVELTREGNENNLPTKATSIVNDFIVKYEPATRRYSFGFTRNIVEETDHRGIKSDYINRAKECFRSLSRDPLLYHSSDTSSFVNSFQIIEWSDLNDNRTQSQADKIDSALTKLGGYLKMLDERARSGKLYSLEIAGAGGEYARYMPKEIKFPSRTPEHLRVRAPTAER